MKVLTLVVALGLLSLPAFSSVEVTSYEGLSDDAVLQLEVDEMLEENFEVEREERFERRPIRRRRFVCVARNRRGRRFVGRGLRPLPARRRALRNCRSGSRRILARTCRVVRCRVVRR